MVASSGRMLNADSVCPVSISSMHCVLGEIGLYQKLRSIWSSGSLLMISGCFMCRGEDRLMWKLHSLHLVPGLLFLLDGLIALVSISLYYP